MAALRLRLSRHPIRRPGRCREYGGKDGLGLCHAGPRSQRKKPISDAITITATKDGTTSAGMVVWGDGVWGSPAGIQDVVTYSASVRDPVTAYLKIKTADIPGRITVKKVDAEGDPLSGIRFLLESSADQVNWQEVNTAETDADGLVCWGDLTADGSTYYRVTEVQTAEGMTLLAEPLFVGALDASSHDITITACNNAGFALPSLGLISTAFAAPTIDSGRKASLSLYKYDITAASEDGAWNTASYVSTGVQDDAVTDKLAQYAIQGVEFTYLQVADIAMNNELVDGRRQVKRAVRHAENTVLQAIGLTA